MHTDFENRLKDLVETYSHQIAEQNALSRRAREKTLTAEDVECYLTNMFYVFANTLPACHYALIISRSRNNEKMAEFCVEKMEDEKGHEVWAQDDLKHLGIANGLPNFNLVSQQSKDLVQYGRDVIDIDENFFSVYTFCFEYLTVVEGPKLLAQLEELGFSRESMSGLGYHVDLDKHHIEDDIKIILDTMRENHPEAMLEVARKTMDHLHKFLEYCVIH